MTYIRNKKQGRKKVVKIKKLVRKKERKKLEESEKVMSKKDSYKKRKRGTKTQRKKEKL